MSVDAAIDLEAAHKRSIRHRAEILASRECGCFHCRSWFPPSAIAEWVDANQTAMCPRCGIDSVIGDASGIALTEAFLDAMQARWFEGC